MKIAFYGAAGGNVTGSNHYLEVGNTKLLIDCGLFQGNTETEKLNEVSFAYSPEDIDFLLLTHAHIDHSGRIPKLVKDGFRGRIIATNPTYELCKIMLKDSAKIQASDVEWENRKRQRAGKPLIEPLYTIEEVEQSLNYFEPYFVDQIIKLNDSLTICFRDAGHVLGSAIIELWAKEEDETVKIVFSGDLGLPNRPILRDPTFIESADYLIIESTYGDRNHTPYADSSQALIDIIEATAKRGGTTVIPAFAVGRTQELIYRLNQYYEHFPEDKQSSRIPVYVDSPMAVDATETFQKNSSSFDDETRELILQGDNPFTFSNLTYIRDQEESARLNKNLLPKVIISSSGMANAGRVRHHLKHNLWDPKNALIFVGYQAEGTLGRILLDGKKRVKILGEEIQVKASIHNLEGFSAHADQEFLLEWIGKFDQKPRKVFIVHGEKGPRIALASLIKHLFGLDAFLPELGESFELKGSEVRMESKLDADQQNADLEREYDEVKKQLEALEEKIYSEQAKGEREYIDIKNKLIELQYILMNLNMDRGK